LYPLIICWGGYVWIPAFQNSGEGNGIVKFCPICGSAEKIHSLLGTTEQRPYLLLQKMRGMKGGKSGD
jgi:hypothetical protein